MAREKQSYEYVMDVALRATLKEHGFKRKTYATYIRETEDQVWIFELQAELRLGAGFDDIVGVRLSELDRIFEKYAPGRHAKQGVTRTPSHVTTSITHLMEIAEGHDYYTIRRGPTAKSWSKEYEAAQSDTIMKYRRYGWWAFSTPLPRTEEGEEGWARYDREAETEEEALGHFLDEMWRKHILLWYRRCDDPLFVVDWLEQQNRVYATADCTLAALCHLGGDDERAAGYLRRSIEAAEISYEGLYRKLYNEYRGSWLRRLWEGGARCSEEELAEWTLKSLERYRNIAETAGMLVDGLGIAV